MGGFGEVHYGSITLRGTVQSYVPGNYDLDSLLLDCKDQIVDLNQPQCYYLVLIAHFPYNRFYLLLEHCQK